MKCNFYFGKSSAYDILYYFPNIHISQKNVTKFKYAKD